jgi:hypothetical protein
VLVKRLETAELESSVQLNASRATTLWSYGCLVLRPRIVGIAATVGRMGRSDCSPRHQDSAPQTPCMGCGVRITEGRVGQREFSFETCDRRQLPRPLA